jgi:hypothetical protein
MLAERGLQLESIGGDIVGVPISALKVKKNCLEEINNGFSVFI